MWGVTGLRVMLLISMCICFICFICSAFVRLLRFVVLLLRGRRLWFSCVCVIFQAFRPGLGLLACFCLARSVECFVYGLVFASCFQAWLRSCQASPV